MFCVLWRHVQREGVLHVERLLSCRRQTHLRVRPRKGVPEANEIRLAIDVMTQNPLARNKDVLAAVKCHMPITPCEEKALVQFVSSRTSTAYGKVPKDLASLVIPDCLKVVGTSLDHGDKTFLIFDSFDDDKECDRILIFHRMGCGKEPPPPSKYLPMGHIGRRQTRLRHCTPCTPSLAAFHSQFSS